jgi:hypothetical protein
MSCTCMCVMDSSGIPSRSDERELRSRVEAEFREMPGLKLTLPQASRLFSIECARCEEVLGALVHAGQLTTDGKAFARARADR